jgi:hypothetical protein
MKFDPGKLVRLRRPRYVEGKLLSADDFKAEQEYQLERQWQHNRMLHGYGVVVGLEVGVEENDKGWQVIVSPGYGLDGWGREIVVTEPLSANLPGDRHDLTVYLKFVETDEDDSERSAALSQKGTRLVESAGLTYEPTGSERAPAPPTRADFAIPIARLKRPHHVWQRDRDFRPARAR